LTGLALIAFFALTTAANNAGDIDDDEVAAAFEEMEGFSAGVRVAIGLTCVKLVLNAAGIYGATTYTLWAVAASAAGFALEVLMSLIHFDIGSLLMAGGFLYPHVYLIMEMRNGILSKETYEQEKFSCCCV
jgi:Ni,Fe-hydrogenase I cytochrome b subunit